MKPPKKLSKRTKRGLITGLLLMFCVIITPRILQSFLPDNGVVITKESFDEFKSDVELRSDEYQRNRSKSSYSKSKRYAKPPKAFDPNSYSVDDWLKLGVTEKQATVIHKFIQRTVYSNEELKQIYVLPSELYELIKDSTFYPTYEYQKPQTDKMRFDVEENEFNNRKIQHVELNTATKDELIQIPGIGSYFADKIIEHRTKLGGFTNQTQLLEIWRFDQEKLDGIHEFLEIDKSKVTKLNINTATAEELQNHPYINWNIANSIIKMKGKYREYSSLEQLLESDLISKELLNKLKPYLTL